MEIDLFTVLFTASLSSLLIERVFYYRSKYKKKNGKWGNPGNSGNPSDRERLATLEEKTDNIEKDIKRIWKKLNKE